MGNVVVTLGQGNLGLAAAADDGILGLVCNGAAEGSLVLGTPFLITSLTDATNLGLTSANNPLAYKLISNFYNETIAQGVNGVQLYVMLTAPTLKINMICDKTNANGAIKLLTYANGKIKVLLCTTDDAAVATATSTSTTITNGMNADVYTAITNAQALGAQMFSQQTPIRIILGGTSFNGTASALTDQTTAANNRVATLIGDTVTGIGAAVGLLGGRVAAIPVQRKVSRVRNGALSSATAYIGTTTADQYTQAAVIAGKGYISIQTYPQKSGFFFTGDPTCTATTDDYGMLARGRVIDKAHRLAYATYINEVDDEVPVQADGTIDPIFAKYLEQQIENTINTNMTANNEISAIGASVSLNQNVLQTNKVAVVLKVLPVGYSTEIDVTLGFTSSL